jgi:hypothetical protein
MTAARLATDRLTRALLNVAARGARTHSSDPTGHLSDDLGLSASTEHYPPRFGCESLIVTGDDIRGRGQLLRSNGLATHRHHWLFTRLNPLHQLILCSAALFPPLAFDCPALPPTCCIEDHSHRDVEDGEAKLCCRHDVAFPHMILYPTKVGSNGAAAPRAEQCFGSVD